VRPHAAVAYRTAVLLGAGSEADDVVQVAFVKAYRALGAFRAGSAFRPWLLRIVANETRNTTRAARRRRNATERSVEIGADVVPDPASEAMSRERREMLLAAVRQLPEVQRLAVVCRYFLELDEEETAAMLGWPRGTVKSRLHRALRRLRTKLAEDQEPSAATQPSADADAAEDPAAQGGER
jgi:RNA polymerase sigma factor (sigma-70 family)